MCAVCARVPKKKKDIADKVKDLRQSHKLTKKKNQKQKFDHVLFFTFLFFLRTKNQFHWVDIHFFFRVVQVLGALKSFTLLIYGNNVHNLFGGVGG